MGYKRGTALEQAKVTARKARTQKNLASRPIFQAVGAWPKPHTAHAAWKDPAAAAPCCSGLPPSVRAGLRYWSSSQCACPSAAPADQTPSTDRWEDETHTLLLRGGTSEADIYREKGNTCSAQANQEKRREATNFIYTKVDDKACRLQFRRSTSRAGSYRKKGTAGFAEAECQRAGEKMKGSHKCARPELRPKKVICANQMTANHALLAPF
eukprot:1160828-Pelagomonas_calceolata.AAC.12